jgi:hypothetical protein
LAGDNHRTFGEVANGHESDVTLFAVNILVIGLVSVLRSWL